MKSYYNLIDRIQSNVTANVEAVATTTSLIMSMKRSYMKDVANTKAFPTGLSSFQLLNPIFEIDMVPSLFPPILNFVPTSPFTSSIARGARTAKRAGEYR